jgi:hypothetical protein
MKDEIKKISIKKNKKIILPESWDWDNLLKSKPK